MEKENNRLNEVISSAMKNLNGLIDVNTVVGKPIKTDEGDFIIPISKVTFGILSGGGEYGKLNLFKKGADLPYSAGNGSIVSIKPCAFLIKPSNEKYTLLSVSNNSYEKMFETTANMLNEQLSNES